MSEVGNQQRAREWPSMGLKKPALPGGCGYYCSFRWVVQVFFSFFIDFSGLADVLLATSVPSLTLYRDAVIKELKRS